MEKEFICMLHSEHDCKHRNYSRRCDMREDSGYATVACKYRVVAVVLTAEEPVESPENVVQQGQPKKNAVTMEIEIKDVF